MDETQTVAPTPNLAEAFKPEKAPRNNRSDKKKAISLTVLIAGLVVLVAGIVFLVVRLLQTPAVPDGEYLVSIGEWTLDDSDKVVWDFTEIGKGKLTTDGHQHDYDFIWALKDGELLIETDWLYELESNYEYKLDQDKNTLTLVDGENEINFTATKASD